MRTNSIQQLNESSSYTSNVDDYLNTVNQQMSKINIGKSSLAATTTNNLNINQFLQQEQQNTHVTTILPNSFNNTLCRINSQNQTQNPLALQRLSMPSVVINSKTQTISNNIPQQKQRPSVAVLPIKKSQQQIKEEHEIIYKNNCFGLIDSVGIKAPPKLNLYRTSQILSEFTELPKSLNGETLMKSSNYKEDLYTQAHNCPPPPG